MDSPDLCNRYCVYIVSCLVLVVGSLPECMHTRHVGSNPCHHSTTKRKKNDNLGLKGEMRVNHEVVKSLGSTAGLV